MTEMLPRIVGGKIMPTGAERDPHDPPIFLLVASPAWAPWLPDTAFQRVPIGGTGQVLTVQADGSVAWQNSAAGFSNPMTTVGDIIVEGAGPSPTRLAIGTAGQVLTVVAGVPGWQNSAAGFSNPMTTAGDMIIENSTPAPARLPIGGNNQVLTVVGGAPAWANNPAGFANPMTQAGDIITGGLAGAATRLGAGANGQVLTVVSGAPAWATGSNLPSAVVYPSGDTTGVTDQANIAATWGAGLVAHGGEVLLATGAFYVKPPSGNNCLAPPQQTVAYPQGSALAGNPVCIRGLGPATILYPVGPGRTGIYMHRSSGYGAQFGLPAQPACGYLRDFVIDGTLATGASIGLDYGDGHGYDVDLMVCNFATTGAVAVQQINRNFWTEKCDMIRLRLYNNTTALYITTALAPGGDHSSEYMNYDINMFCNANQQGIVVDGVNMGGSHMFIRGNMSLTNSNTNPPGNIAMLSIINAAGVTPADGKRWYQGQIWAKVEGNPGTGSGNAYPYGLYSDGVGYVREVSGHISHSLGNSSVGGTDSQLNGAEFSFSGSVSGDTYLTALVPDVPGSNGTKTTAYTVPATGVIQQNYGPDAVVCVSGGTVSGVTVSGQPTGLTSGAFPVRAGGSVTFNYTAAPTVNWVNNAKSTF